MESWNNWVTRTFDRALGHHGTWLALALVCIAAALIAGVATHRAQGTPSAWAAGLTLGLLALTLLAILWYSFETRNLVRIQREASEIESHPWLHVEAWPIPRKLSPEEAVKGDQFALPIMNVGRTPALISKVSVAHRGPQIDPLVKLEGDANPRVLAPGQQFLATIVTFKGFGPPIRAYLSVTIDYQALQGGGGRVVVWLRYAESTWKSRRTAYAASLASGRTLPAQRIDEADTEVVSYQ